MVVHELLQQNVIADHGSIGIIHITLEAGNVDLLLTNGVVDVLKNSVVEVFTLGIVLDKVDVALESHVILQLGVVEIGVAHDDRVSNDEEDIHVLEGSGIVLVVALSERFDDTINLLTLTRQEESTLCQENTHRSDEVETSEIEGTDVSIADILVESFFTDVASLSNVITNETRVDLGLVLPQEAANV